MKLIFDYKLHSLNVNFNLKTKHNEIRGDIYEKTIQVSQKTQE